jgi:hypothetical protein
VDPGNGGPWEGRTLEIGDPRSGGPSLSHRILPSLLIVCYRHKSAPNCPKSVPLGATRLNYSSTLVKFDHSDPGSVGPGTRTFQLGSVIVVQTRGSQQVTDSYSYAFMRPTKKTRKISYQEGIDLRNNLVTIIYIEKINFP